jgi:hypothetical protein
MSTVTVRLNDGTYHDFDVEHLTSEQAFEYVQQGRMTFDQFEEFLSHRTNEAYCDGCALGQYI